VGVLARHIRSDRRPEELGLFIGRRRERGELWDLLERHRLVTLVGPGGCGKTRLALQVMRDLEAHFSAGTVFVDLSTVSESALVPDAISAALGVKPGRRSSAAALASFLDADPRLMVLDNLEQIEGAGALITDLLLEAVGLTILATSRTSVHAVGERLYVLEPFPVPDEPWSSLEELAGVESVSFLLDRTLALAPGFNLTEANAGAIASVCRRLDGLPLALALVAPQMRTLGPAEVAARLDQGLTRLLASAGEQLPARQRTVGATIAWSESLLEPDAQALLAELSVFAGPFELDAALAVASGGGAALGALDELVDASLVLPGPAGQEARTFRILQTVREYGVGRLALLGAIDTVRECHASWFTDFAVRGASGLVGHDQAAWLRRCDAARDDLEAALDWWIVRTEAGSAQRLAAALSPYWVLTGRLRHGFNRLTSVLELDADSGSKDRLAALTAATRLAFEAVGPLRSAPFAIESAALAQRLGDDRALCRAKQALGLYDLRRGHAANALARLEGLLPLARRIGDPGLLSSVLSSVGTAAEMIGDTARSDEARLEVAEIARAIGDTEMLGGCLVDRGYFLGLRGSWVAGADLIQEGAEILRPLGMTSSLTWALLQLSMVESRLGRTAEAREHLLEALPAALDEGDDLKLTNVVRALFALALANGRSTEAESLWPVLLTALRAYGIVWQRPGFLEDLARWLTSVAGHGTVRRRLSAAPVPVESSDLEATIRTARVAPERPPEVPPAPRHRGRYELTGRELEVLALLVAGHSDAEIAQRLGMSAKTASVHVSNIKGKLGADSRTGAVVEALRLGLVVPRTGGTSAS
jgi:predicted ATPase/DNA-binding CsgD family transcriptional regulator